MLVNLAHASCANARFGSSDERITLRRIVAAAQVSKCTARRHWQGESLAVALDLACDPARYTIGEERSQACCT